MASSYDLKSILKVPNVQAVGQWYIESNRVSAIYEVGSNESGGAVLQTLLNEEGPLKELSRQLVADFTGWLEKQPQQVTNMRLSFTLPYIAFFIHLIHQYNSFCGHRHIYAPKRHRP